jgi:hypothetical protein
MQQVNITIRADEWPTHLRWNLPAIQIVQPLVAAAHRARIQTPWLPARSTTLFVLATTVLER